MAVSGLEELILSCVPVSGGRNLLCTAAALKYPSPSQYLSNPPIRILIIADGIRHAVSQEAWQNL